MKKKKKYGCRKIFYPEWSQVLSEILIYYRLWYVTVFPVSRHPLCHTPMILFEDNRVMTLYQGQSKVMISYQSRWRNYLTETRQTCSVWPMVLRRIPGRFDDWCSDGKIRWNRIILAKVAENLCLKYDINFVNH
jgi:hypothetical protein